MDFTMGSMPLIAPAQQLSPPFYLCFHRGYTTVMDGLGYQQVLLSELAGIGSDSFLQKTPNPCHANSIHTQNMELKIWYLQATWNKPCTLTTRLSYQKHGYNCERSASWRYSIYYSVTAIRAVCLDPNPTEKWAFVKKMALKRTLHSDRRGDHK